MREVIIRTINEIEALKEYAGCVENIDEMNRIINELNNMLITIREEQ